MPKVQNSYTNPPVREAIITISFSDSIDYEKLSNFIESEFAKKTFPSCEEEIALKFKVPNTLNEKASMDENISHEKDGFILRNEDSKLILKIKGTYISYHNLTPYIGWELFIQNFKEIWIAFCNIAGEVPVSELTARYVNQINIPLPIQYSFNEYIILTPTLPDGLPKAWNNFFLQINFPNEAKSLTGVVTETFSPPDSSAKHLIFIMDINVIKKEMISCRSNQVWESFAEIRQFKNDIFESCITDMTKSIFK